MSSKLSADRSTTVDCYCEDSRKHATFSKVLVDLDSALAKTLQLLMPTYSIHAFLLLILVRRLVKKHRPSIDRDFDKCMADKPEGQGEAQKRKISYDTKGLYRQPDKTYTNPTHQELQQVAGHALAAMVESQSEEQAGADSDVEAEGDSDGKFKQKEGKSILTEVNNKRNDQSTFLLVSVLSKLQWLC